MPSFFTCKIKCRSFNEQVFDLFPEDKNVKRLGAFHEQALRGGEKMTIFKSHFSHILTQTAPLGPKKTISTLGSSY